MKAKVPEKIWINPLEDLQKLSGHIDKDSIEYVRKDAFIEKACEWLEEHKEHPFIGCEDPCLSGYLTNEFIEDFRRAMNNKRAEI